MITTFYKLRVLRDKAEALLPKWRNQGWEPTVVRLDGVLCIVTLDLVTDKQADPTQHKGIVGVLT